MTTTLPIEWTQQHPFLWTGRRDDQPIGTIERGARFTFIDAAGAEHHGFRTLRAAQAAAQELMAPVRVEIDRARSAPAGI